MGQLERSLGYFTEYQLPPAALLSSNIQRCFSASQMVWIITLPT